MAEFQDMAITGELIVSMPQEERWFELLEEPKYELINKEKPKEEENVKLAFHVKLSNGTVGTYYPNKTSARKVATINKTTDMVKWLGKYYWGFSEKKMVGGAIKDVIYVTSVYPLVTKV